MYQLFGITPILIILCLVFSTLILAFLLAQFINQNKDSNAGVQLFVGLSVILSITAIILTAGKTVFTPSLLVIFLLFKPKLKEVELNLKLAIKQSLHFFLIFLLLLVSQILREDYFSSEVLTSSFGDYSFYLTAAENIYRYGQESAIAYLGEYGMEVSPNLYHYFDLYLLTPIFLAKIPPLIGYLFYFLPFVYSIFVYSLIHLFSNEIALKQVFLALLAVHIIGYSFQDFEPYLRLSLIRFPKSALMILPLLLLVVPKWNIYKRLVACVLLSLMISTLVFVLMLAATFCIVVFLCFKNSIKEVISQLFSKNNLVAYVGFLLYFLLILTSKSEGSVIQIEADPLTLKETVIKMLSHFVGYLGVVKILPILPITLIGIVVFWFKRKTLNIVVLFIIISFSIGHLLNTYLFYHYEGGQFYAIPIVVLLSISFYYSMNIVLLDNRIVNYFYKGVLLVLFFIPFFFGGSKLFTEPKGYNPSSISFNTLINEELATMDDINGLFFNNITNETPWIECLPHLMFQTGYLKLYQNVNCIKALHPNMFPENKNLNSYARNLISKGPFFNYCVKNGWEPTNWDDSDYAQAIVGFIKNQKINVLIFEKGGPNPSWLNKLSNKRKLSTQKSIDNHIVYILG